MELVISFMATGLLIILVTLWRSRKIMNYKQFADNLETTYRVYDLDLTGDTEYTNCIAYKWVFENVTQRKHSNLGVKFQNHLMDNTLSAAIGIGLLLGVAALVIGAIVIQSLIVIGISSLVLFNGVLLAIGPGAPRVSDDLLTHLLKYDLDDLNREDYMYTKLAINSIMKWNALSFIIGTIFLVMSPWAEITPQAAAFLVALISNYLFWNPAILLAEIWFPLALLYLAVAIPFAMYLVVVIIKKLTRSD